VIALIEVHVLELVFELPHDTAEVALEGRADVQPAGVAFPIDGVRTRLQ
jgi:hypothetical protein